MNRGGVGVRVRDAERGFEVVTCVCFFSQSAAAPPIRTPEPTTTNHKPTSRSSKQAYAI